MRWLVGRGSSTGNFVETKRNRARTAPSLLPFLRSFFISIPRSIRPPQPASLGENAIENAISSFPFSLLSSPSPFAIRFFCSRYPLPWFILQPRRSSASACGTTFCLFCSPGEQDRSLLVRSLVVNLRNEACRKAAY